jgi:pyridoxal 5'-phosphate synthase pdxT subunit
VATIGVLALQGAFIEHEQRLRALGADTTQVRLPEDLYGLDGLIIPGGESTTIGKLAATFGLIEPLRAFARSKPTWGTCAGLIFLARDIGTDRQPILGVMDVVVNRNAFGRQVDSFEADLPVAGLEGGPFHAVFIRARSSRRQAPVWMCWPHSITAGSSPPNRATCWRPPSTRNSRMTAGCTPAFWKW